MKNKLVISLLAILVVVLGLLAVLVSDKNMISPKKYEREMAKVETTSDSDDIDSIEKDLEETNLDNLDSELVDIQSELN